MRTRLILGLAVLCAAPAQASTSAHCDATPFSLGKPAAAAPKVESAKPKPRPAPPAIEEAAKKPPEKPIAKQRLLASCKAGKKKSD